MNKNEKEFVNNQSDTDLDDEEFIVEKILNMRRTKKGKVQCKINRFFLFNNNL